MRQILPELITQNYKSGIYNGDFKAAGLFVDVASFSSMADTLMQQGQHGAEILAGIMRQVFDLLNSNILAQGGFIAGFAGDSVTAIFIQEDESTQCLHRALAAAQTFQKELSTLPAFDTPFGKFQIYAKAGLGFGAVQWGILRSRDALRATYYFSGELINEMAGAEHLAGTGEVILSQHFLEKFDGKIITQPREQCYLFSSSLEKLPEKQAIITKDPDLGVLRVFFPEILLKPNVPLEYRQVVNLFIQLPNISTASLADFMADLFEIQIRYSGLISRLDHGDKGCNILLFWGAPIAFENDILRALNFIFDLRKLDKYNFRAGLTFYVACAGFMGSDRREEYTCYGRGVNLSARFMMSAPVGEIWLDERIATRALNYFSFEYIGEKIFKGFGSKQKVFVLQNPKTSATISYSQAMVGRENELLQLEEFISPIWLGQFAGGLMIWGEPGIGKSRLLNEFRESGVFTDREVQWALCQTNQLLQQSFDPFRYWLTRYFDISANRNHDENLARFHSRLQKIIDLTSDETISSELQRTASFLAALVGLHWSDSLYNQLDPQGRHDNTLIALTMLIKAESLVQPVIILLEDYHFIDEDSKAFLPLLHRSLSTDVNSYPVAIIYTSRQVSNSQEINPDIFERQMILRAISKKYIEQLAQTNLQGPIDPTLIRLLDERSEGNPFFAEQIISYLRDENLLRYGESGWKIGAPEVELTIPIDLQAILIARLDQLTREIRDIIQTASVLGREFEIQVLSYMLTADQDLTLALAEGEKVAIWSRLTELRYIFHHSLLRDAAYNMQMKGHREKLHALAIESIEKVFGELIEPHFGELAFHSEQAGLVDKARHYLLMAGDSSRGAFQNTIAVDYYTRALALTPETDLPFRFILHLNREKAFGFQGLRERQLDELNKLLTLSTGLDQASRAEAGLRDLKFHYHTGNYSLAISRVKSVLKLARQAKKPDIALQAHVYCANSYFRQGNYQQAIRWGRRGLALAQDGGDHKMEAKFLNSLGLIYLELKNLQKARQYFESSLIIVNEISALNTKASILNNLAMVAGFYGDFASAQSYYDQALDLSRAVGDRKGESIVLSNLGWINGMLGNYVSAQDYTQRTLVISRETGDRFTETYCLINLSAQVGARGDHEAAIAFARQGLDLALMIGDQSGQAWAWTYMGHNFLATNLFLEASAAYQSALSLRERLNQPVMAFEPAAGLARISLIKGDIQDARRLIDPILAHLDDGGNFEGTDEPLRIYFNCYLILEAAGHPRSKEILELGYRSMQQRIANIQDESARENYARDILYNREFLATWHQSQSESGNQ